MASGQSEVSICNLALSLLGEVSITSLGDDTKQARECQRIYAITRDQELRAHNWNFSIKRTDLAADPDEAAWGYQHRYQLPDDCLKTIQVDGTQNWRVEAGNFADSGKTFILTDLSAPIYILYVSRITDPALFDVSFVEALSVSLAFKLALPLTQSNTISQEARDVRRTALAQAKAVNSIESGPRSFRESSWLLARN